MERISVIVPIYNVEAELPRCVDSIRSQTYTDLQIVLIDDGSTDGCSRLCDAYAAEDSRVRVVHQEHKGVSDARNVGVDTADGTYIMFVDSDDYIEPDMAEKLFCALQKADADMSMCSFQYDCTAVPDQADRFPTELPIEDGVLSGRQIMTEKMFIGSGVWYVTLWNKLYRRHLFDRVRFPVGKVNEDEFAFHAIMLQCEKVACIRDVLYHYVIRPGSIMHSSFYIQRFDGAEAVFQRAELFADQGFPALDVCRTLERGLTIFKPYYASSMTRDAACRKRYRSLLRRFRRMAVRYIFATGLPIQYRVIFILKTISPYLCWRIMRNRSV